MIRFSLCDFENFHLLSYRSSSDKSDSEENEMSLAVRRKIEHALQRLPSIEDLKMSVDEDKCKPVGFIVNIIKEIGNNHCTRLIILKFKEGMSKNTRPEKAD